MTSHPVERPRNAWALSQSKKRHLAPRSKPLHVYTGILPSPKAQLPTIKAQFNETLRHTLQVHCDKHVLVDQNALRQRSSPAPWDALFTPEHDVPLWLFLLTLHHCYSPSFLGASRQPPLVLKAPSDPIYHNAASPPGPPWTECAQWVTSHKPS